MEIQSIPLTKIRKNLIVNCRYNFNVEDLVESIGATGLQIPIGVAADDNGEYGLVYGFRRYSACEQLGWETIPARVVSSQDQADLLVMNLQENVSRQNLSPMEEAYAIKRIIDAGKSVEEFRAALGWSKTLITQRLALLDMTLVVQDALERDAISVMQARAINEADHNHHESLIMLAEDGATVRAIKDEIDQIKRVGNDEEETLVLTESEDELFVEDEDEGEECDGKTEDRKATAEANSNLIKANLLDVGAKSIKDNSAWFAYSVAINALDFSKLPHGEIASLVNATQTLSGEYGLDAWGEAQKR